MDQITAARLTGNLTILDELGIKPPKALTDARNALTRCDDWRADYRAAKTSSAAFLDAVRAGDRKALDTAAMTTAAAETALSELTDLRDTLVNDVSTAGLAHVRACLPTITERFNKAAAHLTHVWRDDMHSRPVTFETIVSAGLSEPYNDLRATAATLDQLAQILDGSTTGRDDYGTRYGRNLLHAYTTRTETHAVYQAQAAANGNSRPTRTEWQWLDEPAMAPMRRWLTILEAPARPGTSTFIAYDPDADAADRATFEAIHSEYTGGARDTGTAAVTATTGKLDDVAARYWTKRRH